MTIQRHLNRRDSQIFAHDKLAKEKDAVGLRLEFRALDVHLGGDEGAQPHFAAQLAQLIWVHVGAAWNCFLHWKSMEITGTSM